MASGESGRSLEVNTADFYVDLLHTEDLLVEVTDDEQRRAYWRGRPPVKASKRLSKGR